MAATKRGNLVTSRRRVADEGDDDEADVASAEFESQSEVSALTGANESLDQGSERSDPGSPGVSKTRAERAAAQTRPSVGVAKTGNPGTTKKASTMPDQPSFTNTADTNAMINGLSIHPTDGDHEEAIQFDDPVEEPQVKPQANDTTVPPHRTSQGQPQAKSTAPNAPSLPLDANDPAIRARSDPSFVPSRGGFFMHDQRNGNAGRGDSGTSTRGRGRGRAGFGGVPAFNHMRQPMNTTDNRWNHDLHDSLKDPLPNSRRPTHNQARPNMPVSAQQPHVKPPSLSKTTTVGLQSMRVMLLGMDKPITYERVPVNKHVRLPDLRPPLRRDKPVRIAIQDNSPKYVFPSVNRSFIFIPRAQRPNQQRFKGRGYYSQFGSRRNSIYGGSNYTSSVAMSRRSSVARDGIMSPTDAVSSRPSFASHANSAKPIVRLPATMRSSGAVTPGASETPVVAPGISSSDVMNTPSYPLPSRPTYRENRPNHIPMHQPRPEKNISVATIESPAPVKMHAPEQQEEQPFHHQVPAHMNGQPSQVEQTSSYHQPYPPNMNGFPMPTEQQPSHQQPAPFGQSQTPTTPSGNLTEQALNVNAQQFHPGQSQMFYPQPYMMPNYYYYPPPDVHAMNYSNSPMQAPPMYVQSTPQGNFLVPILAPPQNQQPPGLPAEAPQSMYESNGMMYYYDPTQYATNNDANGAAPNNYPDQSAGEGMMKPGPEQQLYYQPPQVPMMFYPPQ